MVFEGIGRGEKLRMNLFFEPGKTSCLERRKVGMKVRGELEIDEHFEIGVGDLGVWKFDYYFGKGWKCWNGVYFDFVCFIQYLDEFVDYVFAHEHIADFDFGCSSHNESGFDLYADRYL